MSKLKNTYDFLKKNSSHTLEIWDIDKDDKFRDRHSRPALESFEAFTKEIKSYVQERGAIGLQRMVPNGGGHARYGAQIQIGSKNNTDADRGEARRNPLPDQHQNTKGMNAPNGLNYADMGKLFSYDEIKQKGEKYEKLCETLKEEKHKLEREIDRLTLGKEAKPSAIDKLLENPEVLTGILSTVAQSMQKGGAPAQPNQGLNAPNLSPLKQKFIHDLVQVDPEDSVVQRLAFLLVNYDQGNGEFINKFEKLFKNGNS
jgi:hypothetical protein